MNAISSYPDLELLRMIKAGEELAFQALFDRYWQSMYEKASYILQDTALAQDIVQDVFFSIWVRRGELEMQSVKGYLEQATRFQVFKAIRDRKAGRRLQERLAAVTVEILQDDPLVFKEHQTLLDYLISQLPEDCREVFRLSRQEELSYREIAESLQLPERTVRYRVAKSLEYLRKNYTYLIAISMMWLRD